VTKAAAAQVMITVAVAQATQAVTKAAAAQAPADDYNEVCSSVSSSTTYFPKSFELLPIILLVDVKTIDRLFHGFMIVDP